MEIGGQMQQTRTLLEFSIEDRVMMAADIVGNMAVQNIGEDEGGGAISCVY